MDIRTFNVKSPPAIRKPVSEFLSSNVLMRRKPSSHFKRPVVLPPLPNLNHSALRPMDPLQPPSLLFTESRLGSPAPRSNVPLDSDPEVSSSNGKPIIKITHHETDKHEPLPSEHKPSKRNPAQVPVSDAAPHHLENTFLEIRSKTQTKSHHNEPDKKVKCPPLEGTEDAKVVQIPKRYAPLKPIGQKMHQDEK